MSDIVVIGAGITGSAIARVLSRYQGIEVKLLEKEIDVGWGATKANTGIIHPGHEDDPQRYPLRAELCVKGNRLWHEWTEELDIPVDWPGELMLAKDDREKETLEGYLRIGKKNGVPELRIIGKEELRNLEPMVSKEVEYALWAPTAGVLAPWEAVIALVENAVDNGVDVHLDTCVQDIVLDEGEVELVKTNKGQIEADMVINTAGLFADEISSMVGVDEFEIIPRKGEYYLFDEDVEEKPERVIHPTPTEKTKGVYAVQTVEGNLMLGPTAEDLPQDSKDERSTSEEGLDFIWEHSKGLLDELPDRKRISKTFAGLRPEPPEGKYIIRDYDEISGFINVAGIRSPGLTAAPAIAFKVERILKEQLDMGLEKKEDWEPVRKGITRFTDLNHRQKQEMIKKDADYGKVVCMCKEVTKAEIKEAVDRVLKLGDDVSLDSIKFRTLALFGFCQGSYCRTRIAKVLSEELDINMWDIDTAEKGTSYGIGDVKVLQRGESCD
ncbi:MAG: NAD(P)/FAD-dependent oxidoreductase [Candidatus Saliniplasma sp.]